MSVRASLRTGLLGLLTAIALVALQLKPVQAQFILSSQVYSGGTIGTGPNHHFHAYAYPAGFGTPAYTGPPISNWRVTVVGPSYSATQDFHLYGNPGISMDLTLSSANAVYTVTVQSLDNASVVYTTAFRSSQPYGYYQEVSSPTAGGSLTGTKNYLIDVASNVGSGFFIPGPYPITMGIRDPSGTITQITVASGPSGGTGGTADVGFLFNNLTPDTDYDVVIKSNASSVSASDFGTWVIHSVAF